MFGFLIKRKVKRKMSANITKTVERIVREQLNLTGTRERIYCEIATFRDMGADSLDEVELMMALEDAFGIELDDDVMKNHRTPAKMIAHLSCVLNPKHDTTVTGSGHELGVFRDVE